MCCASKCSHLHTLSSNFRIGIKFYKFLLYKHKLQHVTLLSTGLCYSYFLRNTIYHASSCSRDTESKMLTKIILEKVS